jgi:hypothetical protein
MFCGSDPKQIAINKFLHHNLVLPLTAARFLEAGGDFILRVAQLSSAYESIGQSNTGERAGVGRSRARFNGRIATSRGYRSG